MMTKRTFWNALGWLILLGITGCVQTGVSASQQPLLEATSSQVQASATAAAVASTALVADMTPTNLAEGGTILTTPQLKQETMVPETKITPRPTARGLGVEQWIAQAKEDLAARLGVTAEQIELVDFQEKLWPDGSLGCPQPGMVYIQVPQDGYLIRLRYGGGLYHYHGNERLGPFLCDNPAKEGIEAPSLTIEE